MWSSLTLALLGCTDPFGGGSPLDTAPRASMEITLDADMPLRARVRWDSERFPEAWIQVEGAHRTPVSTTGEQIVLGLPPRSDVPFQLVTAEGVVGEGTIRTGALPADLPVPELLTDPLGEGFIALPLYTLDGNVYAVEVLNAQGQVVWYRRFEGVLTSGGSPPLWAMDAEPGALWLSLSTPAVEDHTGFVKLALDGGPESWITAPEAHHDFVLLEEGALAYTRLKQERVNDEIVTGDEIVVHKADGTDVVAWDSFASLPIQRHNGWDSMPAAPGDWTHANGLDWDPEGRRWVLSLYWLQQIVTVNADGSVSVLDGHITPEYFGPIHGPTWAREGWWMFDNGLLGRNASRALRIDTGGRLLDAWAPPTGGYSPVLGSAEATPVGLLVSMGIVPEVWMHGEDRDFGVRFPVATALGEAVWLESLYAE